MMPADLGSVYRIGVLGAGYWATNTIRVIADDDDSELTVVCDTDADRLPTVESRYPRTRTTTKPLDVIADPDVDAVYIATPPATHADLTRAALRAGKHVLVEKPFTTSTREAASVVELAEAEGLTVMVGHTFLYSPAVLKVKDIVESGELGDIFYIDSQRVNLGKYQESGVLWDLAPHDLSIVAYWMGAWPTTVAANGRSFVSEGREDVVFLNLEFPSGALAQLHLSWLAPTRLRRTTLSGTRRMVVYDDTLGAEAVKVYDRGVVRVPSGFGEAQLTYRSGDMNVPNLANVEPLRAEWAHFVECIRTGATPRSTAVSGLRTVEVLEAAERALRTGRREPVVRGTTTRPDELIGAGHGQ